MRQTVSSKEANSIINKIKSILIGSVGSSKEVLQAMIELNFPVSYVFSLDEKYSTSVSGYQPIHLIAKGHGIPYKKFYKINDQANIDIIQNIAPDYIFVIGLSQLINEEIMNSASNGVIGFHPTPLPKMRGRAANVWQVLLGIHKTKCSMFFIDQGVDSGPIIGQESYCISDDDYAEDVGRKIDEAVAKLSRRVLREIMDGTLQSQAQDESQATYLLLRRPEDGKIDWDKSIIDIHRLVRAVSRPYPGAFGLYDGKHKIIIWRANIIENNKYVGILGQIADVDANSFTVVCKDGLLKVTDFENIEGVALRVGHKLR
jgi:methionyl-tRNA formyltransferase